MANIINLLKQLQWGVFFAAVVALIVKVEADMADGVITPEERKGEATKALQAIASLLMFPITEQELNTVIDFIVLALNRAGVLKHKK